MPLSPAAPRTHLHDRVISISGYEREDGLWDIEGHLVDTKTYGFENRWRGHVAPGTPVHQMWVRLTIDDKRTIIACEAATDHSPFEICPSITPAFAALKDIRIGPGWMRQVRALVGGRKGCTHIIEMMAQMATVAFQTMGARRHTDTAEKSGDESAAPSQKRRPLFIDSCHAWAADGDTVKTFFPEFYASPASNAHEKNTTKS